MGATATYSLPYPELDEPDDVPTDMRELATAVEALPPLAYWTAPSPGNLKTTRFAYVERATPDDAALGAKTPADPAWRWWTTAGGFMRWGDGTAYDTTLYRSSAGVLTSDGSLRVANDLRANSGSADQVWIGHTGGALAPRIVFGNGLDTNLYRLAASTLRTDGQFQAIGGIVTGSGNGQIWLNTNAAIYFSDLADTYLYRSAALQLSTNGELTARVGANAVTIGAIGPGYGMLVAGDTTLYRYAANWLATGGTLWAGWTTAPGGGEVSVVAAGDGWPRVQMLNNGYLSFGPGTAGLDTNLYRAAANQLATDDAFLMRLDYLYPGANMSGVFPKLQAANSVGAAIGWNFSGGEGEVNFWNTYAGHGGNVPSFKFVQMTGAGTSTHCLSINADGTLTIGQPADTNLYRSATSQLKTDGEFRAGGQIVANVGGSAQLLFWPGTGGRPEIVFGSGGDTNFYRSGGGALKTDGTFNAGAVQIGGSGIGVAGDTSFYRVAAGYWKTDGSLIVGGKFRYGNWVEAANPGAALVARIPVYDVNETRTGYLHIYDS